MMAKQGSMGHHLVAVQIAVMVDLLGMTDQAKKEGLFLGAQVVGRGILSVAIHKEGKEALSGELPSGTEEELSMVSKRGAMDHHLVVMCLAVMVEVLRKTGQAKKGRHSRKSQVVGREVRLVVIHQEGKEGLLGELPSGEEEQLSIVSKRGTMDHHLVVK